MSTKLLIPLCAAVALLAACDRGDKADAPADATTTPGTPAETPPPSDMPPPADAPPPGETPPAGETETPPPPPPPGG